MINFFTSITKKLASEAKIQGQNQKKDNQLSLIIIEQVHHSYAPQVILPSQSAKLTNEINELQKKIFQILSILDEEGLELLGIEDISYKDDEEIDQAEALKMVKNSEADKISTWHYETVFPGHFKTFCPDIINIGGIRRAVGFAGTKLMGNSKNLIKQQEYFQAFFTEHLLNLTSAEKNAIWNQIRAHHKKNSQVSYTALFLNMVINSQVQGFIEALGEYFAATAITAYLAKCIHQDFSHEKDRTESLLPEIQSQFTELVQELFETAEKKADFDLMAASFMNFLEITYKETVLATFKFEKLLNEERSKIVVTNCQKIMFNEQKNAMIIVFGAAHSGSLLKECRKQRINCLIIRPKHPLWEKINL